MVVTADKPASQDTAFELGQVEYVEANQILEKFQLCPESLYVRGRSNLDRERIEVMAMDMLVQVLDDSKKANYVYQIIDPLRFFVLTEEQIYKWGIADAEAGINYLLNGNTRYSALTDLLARGKNIKPVPIQQVILTEKANELVLQNLQSKWNDTTKPHTALSKIKAMAEFIKRQEALGVKSSEITKMCCSMRNVSTGYVSNARLFLDPSDMTEEEAKERSKLFGLLDEGLLTVDATVAIIQYNAATKEKNQEKTFSEILKSLEDTYGLPKATSKKKSLFSKEQVANWIKNQEALIQQTTEEEKQKKNPLTQEEIKSAKEEIQTGVSFLQREMEESSLTDPELLDIYKTSSRRLLNVYKNVVDALPPEAYKRAFAALSSLVTGDMPAVIESLPPEKIETISKNLKAIHEDILRPNKDKKTEGAESVPAETPDDF
jgi:hypothetical protein